MNSPRTIKRVSAKTRSRHARRTPLTKFARRLLREWRVLGLPNSKQPVIVAVSGGADSVALLLSLDELRRAEKLEIEIVVAHVNHKLRAAASDADARWVGALARRLGHKFVVHNIDVGKRVEKSKDNLEQAARNARYEFFAAAAKSRKSKFVLTAHTMNDQAETILLNLIRGSGIDGLSGIEPVRPLQSGSKVRLARPLLSWARRQDTEEYCQRAAIDYRQDEMNLDDAFTRVRIRNELLPSLEQFNPKFVETISRSAEIVREDSSALDLAATELLGQSIDNGTSQSLLGDVLRTAPIAVRRRAIRLWLARQRGNLRRIERAHIVAIENLLLSTKSGRTIQLPGGAAVARSNGRLHYRPRVKPK